MHETDQFVWSMEHSKVGGSEKEVVGQAGARCVGEPSALGSVIWSLCFRPVFLKIFMTYWLSASGSLGMLVKNVDSLAPMPHLNSQLRGLHMWHWKDIKIFKIGCEISHYISHCKC